jgi:hypothetical protein
VVEKTKTRLLVLFFVVSFLFITYFVFVCVCVCVCVLQVHLFVLGLNSHSSCLSFLRARITDMYTTASKISETIVFKLLTSSKEGQ